MPKIMHDENQCELVFMSLDEWEKYKEVIEKAKVFSEVRKIIGYDDDAPKSAGWYLSEAVNNLRR